MDLNTFLFGLFTGALIGSLCVAMTWLIMRKQIGRDRERTRRELEEQARRETDQLREQQAAESVESPGSRSRSSYR